MRYQILDKLLKINFLLKNNVSLRTSLKIWTVLIFCIGIRWEAKAQIYWASEVVEYSDITLLTENLKQLIGEPNVMPHGKINKSAFSANFSHGQPTEQVSPQTIKVRFDSVKHIQKIFVVENFGVSIKNVHLYNTENQRIESFTLNDNFDMNLDLNSKISYISLYRPTAYKVKFLEIEIYPPLYGDEVSQIDAIGVQEGLVEKLRSSSRNMDDNYTLTGSVLDEESTQPLAQVEVKITDLQSGTIQKVWTNSKGLFQIGLRKSSVYQVEAHKTKFFQTRRRSVFTVSYQLHHRFRLQFMLRRIHLNEMYQLSGVRFIPNSTKFRKSSMKSLEDFYKFLKENHQLTIQLEIHTDARGEAEHNLKLTEQRAKALQNYLIEKGIQKQRLTSIGKGETQLINHCQDGVLCSSREHAENRRVEFRVIDLVETIPDNPEGKPAQLKY